MSSWCKHQSRFVYSYYHYLSQVCANAVDEEAIVVDAEAGEDVPTTSSETTNEHLVPKP